MLKQFNALLKKSWSHSEDMKANFQCGRFLSVDWWDMHCNSFLVLNAIKIPVVMTSNPSILQQNAAVTRN